MRRAVALSPFALVVCLLLAIPLFARASAAEGDACADPNDTLVCGLVRPTPDRD
jgi:hypothetical protein